MYIFDIVEVVPDATSGLKRWYRLKLLCKDEAKGPVTALCGMDNYLVSSMGQKVRFCGYFSKMLVDTLLDLCPSIRSG